MIIGIIINSLKKIDFKKDSSLAIILKAKERGHTIYYININSLYLKNQDSLGTMYEILDFKKDEKKFYLENKENKNLKDLDIIFMRQDPPVNKKFLYVSYILENAEKQGTLIINKPKSLRDYNEKIFATLFSNITPETLITCKIDQIYQFWKKNHDIVLKTLDGMGGKSIFRIRKNDQNFTVIVNILTNYGKKYCLVQNYLKEIKDGDKRIFLIDGKPIKYCLARIPKRGEFRGNLAAGGSGEIRKLTNTDLKIANFVGNVLRKKGIIFAGIDVIGNKLTEINITSPTCIREIEANTDISITDLLFNVIEDKIKKIT